MAGRENDSRIAAIDAMEMPGDGNGAYSLACYWARAGDHAEAIRHLRSAVDQGMVLAWVARDPDLESLHGHPEFEAIIDEINELLGEE